MKASFNCLLNFVPQVEEEQLNFHEKNLLKQSHLCIVKRLLIIAGHISIAIQKMLVIFAKVPVPKYRGKSTGVTSTLFLQNLAVPIH